MTSSIWQPVEDAELVVALNLAVPAELLDTMLPNIAEATETRVAADLELAQGDGWCSDGAIDFGTLWSRGRISFSRGPRSFFGLEVPDAVTFEQVRVPLRKTTVTAY